MDKSPEENPKFDEKIITTDVEMTTNKHGPLIGAIDEGTSSTRFMVFSSKTASVIATHQIPIKQYYPNEGWVEQDAVEIIESVKESIEGAIKKMKEKGINPEDIVAIGITNQRETTVLWDKYTGIPLHKAIVWMDMRTTETIKTVLSENPNKSSNQLQKLCGLPLSPYFSSVKIRWLIDNIPDVKKAIDEDRCLFGTIDSWIIWNLTGGVHMTDVTNASCTMLMNIDNMKWDPELCSFFKVPMKILPEIRSCSEIYGKMSCTSLEGVSISGCIGDQQGALMGQLCLQEGETKCTYGTGCFLLCNTGTKKVYSEHGLLTTVAFQLGRDEQPIYALEGSVAIAGAAFAWLRDNINLIKDTSEIDKLADEVTDTRGVYFVPAFSGLYAPYWEPNARGIICGLSEETDYRHIIRATMEAVCYQTKDIVESMNKDIGRQLLALKVDGGMTHNKLLMQIQSDILGIKVVQPSMAENTALGAAIAAGTAKGVEVWNLKNMKPVYNIFYPSINEDERDEKYMRWKMAVDRSFGWNIEYDDL